MLKRFLNWLFPRKPKRNRINDGVPQQIPKPNDHKERMAERRAQEAAERQERNLQMPIPPMPKKYWSDAPPLRNVESGRTSARTRSPDVYPSSNDNLINGLLLHSAIHNVVDDSENSRRSVCDSPSRGDSYDSPSSSDTGSSPCD